MYVTLVLALSLSADAFAVAVAYGTKHGKLPIRQRLVFAAWMGTAEALAPLLGWLLGHALAGYVESFDHWIAFVLLSFLGLRMIAHAEVSSHKNPKFPARLTLPLLFTTALATSADAAIAGLSLRMMDVSLWYAIPIIGGISFLATLLGFKLGKRLGSIGGYWAEVAGGLGLITLGSYILGSHILL